jgi:hypothetical protein
MLVSWLLYGAVVTAQAGNPAADVVTLGDGSVIRGQVVGPAPLGGVTVLVRRDWARANVPGWLGRWERTEAPLILKGRRDRKERLVSWRRERAGRSRGNGDPVVAWIDREVARLSTLRPPRTELTAATLGRSEVRSVVRQPAEAGRLLRQGWLARLDGVESMSVDELTAALQAQGRLRPDDPSPVDPLLPTYPEPDDAWRTRRATTEVAVEPGLRFVRFREFTLPEVGPETEPAPATPSDLIDSLSGRLAFEAIQGVTPFDAVGERLDDIADQGRIGAVVTYLVFAVDSDRAEAESVFMVRKGGGRWERVFTRRAFALTDEPENPDDPRAEGTPIKTALLVLESVASAPSAPEVSHRRQYIGATGGRALARARAALDGDLAPFLLPINPGPR